MMFRFSPSLALWLLASLAVSPGLRAADVIRPKVVVVAMFEPGKDTGDTPGELQFWVEREKLDRVLPLPSAYHDVRANADGSVIAIVTGVGNTRAAATIMALGSDARFDFSKSYWLVAGIAGIDPADGTLGCAAWAEWIVNGDLGHEIDPREAPKDWVTGYVPLRRSKPYEQPRDTEDSSQVFHLDAGLVNWAYELTKNVQLPDSEGMAKRRAEFTTSPNAQRAPWVMKGDTLSSETFWHGKLLNQWANDWVKYHTDGKGSYVTTAMEDTGTLQALTWLTRAGKADVRRVLVLRTASNFDGPPTGMTAAESLFGEKLTTYSAYIPSLESAHRVGSVVVHELVKNWARYENTVPTKSRRRGRAGFRASSFRGGRSWHSSRSGSSANHSRPMTFHRAHAVASAATASPVAFGRDAEARLFSPSALLRFSRRAIRATAATWLLTAAGLSAGDGLPVDFHVKLTPETAILGHFSATKKPVVVVPSGATVRIDGGGGSRWGEDVNGWLKENKIPATLETNASIAETVKVLKETTNRLPPTTPPPSATGVTGLPVSTGGHMLVGPIYIEGAEPGDSLEVRILEVVPRIPYGTVGATPGRGALPDLVPRPWTKVVMLDLARNAGVFDATTEVPLAPFNGVMGTCPPDSAGPNVRSGPPGLFGGNLDCKELTMGATLYLPVYQKGALFYTGDCHAAQGDGEITINAIETSNTAVFQFIVHKGKTLKAPRAENATHYITFGLDPVLDKAMRMAMEETVDFIKEKRNYDFFHAYALTSIAVDFRVTQVVDGTQGIHAMIPKKLFLDLPNTYWYRPRP